MDPGARKVLKEQYVPSAKLCSQIIDSFDNYSVFTTDNELNINSWNSGSSTIFGYTAEDIIGKPFETIFTEEDCKDKVPQLEIDKALNMGKLNVVRWYRRKDGTIFYGDGTVLSLRDEGNVVIGYAIVLRVATERTASEDAMQKYTKELEELNKHKENVISILSHDLRSPLTGIIQGAEYLKTNYDALESSFIKELLDEFHTAIINQLHMLDSLVEWARVKCVAEAFVPTKIELGNLVNRVFKSLKETAAIKQISLNNILEDEVQVYADEKMIISILHNLVSNAIKYSYKGGEIMVIAKKREDMILVEVRDTGRGMSKEMQNKLFVPHIEELSKSVERKKGAGIGLLLAKGFVEKNGGHIWVESELGRGSSFYFTLPITKPFYTSILEQGSHDGVQSNIAC